MCKTRSSFRTKLASVNIFTQYHMNISIPLLPSTLAAPIFPFAQLSPLSRSISFPPSRQLMDAIWSLQLPSSAALLDEYHLVEYLFVSVLVCRYQYISQWLWSKVHGCELCKHLIFRHISHDISRSTALYSNPVIHK